MTAFELSQLLEQQHNQSRPYLEFLQVPSLSVGLYKLVAGAVDPQQPHTEDEVYYVISGRSSFRCESEDREVGPGSILYVPKGVEHRFYRIAEDLTILVFFAPVEYSLKQ